MKIYNPRNWYWFVGGDQTKVFSSKVADYVLVSDATYVAWKADGSVPTKIDTEANLGEVLATYQARPTTSGVLDGYTTALAKNTIALAAFKIEFNHENRLRAIERALSLNGSPPNLTAGQALAAVKALM